ncbi:MAG TPA: HD domain-containing protein, partial [Hyphomicrobium sp.]|nr:HD domain-containing protein [Hyphomicrobium sp.]
MDWTKLLSQTRLCTEAEPSRIRPGRTEFDSDVDRIMFSSSFRRLAKKTQVHPLAANDHVHTRLTHSLEVSRVGRTLGEALADTLIRDAGEKYNPTLPAGIIPDDVGNIVQAACLAHDIGNPPFGHSGEEAIIHWFIQNRSLLPESL